MAKDKKQAGKATKEYKKVRSNAPRVSYTEPSNMYTGPTTQRGITFKEGGSVDLSTPEEQFYETEESTVNDDPKKKLNAKGEKRKIANAPVNPKTGKPITGRESYANAEAFYGPIRTRIEKVFGGREKAMAAMDPALRDKLYYVSKNYNPYYQFFDPGLKNDPTLDQSFLYDKQGNVIMGKITSGDDEGKLIGLSRTSIEGRRYVPPMDETMLGIQKKVMELPDEEIRNLASQKYTDKEGEFLGLSSITMPSNVGFGEKIKYGTYFGKNFLSGWTYENGGPTVTRATYDANGNIIPMINIPEINIVAESPKTSFLNRMNNSPFMQQQQTQLQSQGIGGNNYVSQNQGTLGNTNDRPWYSGVANAYEQAKRNHAVQALGVGAAGAGLVAGGAAAAPYITAATPMINAGLAAPIAGVPGLTTANALGAYGAASFGKHLYQAGQKAYEGAPASEIGYEVAQGFGNLITPGYKALGPIAKAGWKVAGEPTVDTFYTAGQQIVDSTGQTTVMAPQKNANGGMTYGLGSHVVHGGPRWSDVYGSGAMIKRADGSYSPRGLWDNIRANAGSGKKPTKEMLEQERKIRAAEKKADGGMIDMYGDGDKVNLNLPKKETPAPQSGLGFNNYLTITPDMMIRGGVNPMYYGDNFSVGPYATGYAGLQGAGVNDYGVRGTYNINDNFSINADMNPKRINAGLQYKFAKGGSITPTPSGDIFDMMGMSYLNRYAMGATIPCDNPPCPPAIGSMDNPRLVSSVPEGYTQDPNNPRLYVKKSNTASGQGTGSVQPNVTKRRTPTGTTGTTVTPRRSSGTGTGAVRSSGTSVTPRSSSSGTGTSQEDYVYMNEPMIQIQPRPTQLIQQDEIDIQPVQYTDELPSKTTPSKTPTGGGPSDFTKWWRRNIGKPIQRRCDKVMDSTGRFVDKCFEFEDGGTIPFDVKAPLYDETEFNPNINTTLYASGGYTPMYGTGSGIHIKPENRGRFTAWASEHNMSVPQAANRVMANPEDYSPSVVKMANFAKNAAGWKHGYGGYYASGGYTPMYAGGSYIPMYSFGNWITDAGKLAVNTLAAPMEQVSGNNFVNFDYDNKAMADAAAITEGLSGAATDIVGTAFGGPIYGMAKGQLQGVTKNIGKSTEKQKGADDWANKTGQIAGSTGDLIAGIASGNAAQIVGGAGNILGTTGQQFGSQELGTLGQLTGMASQFVGAGKSAPSTTGIGPVGDMVAPQNAMGFFAKNGGNVPAYMQNMRKFAQGGMTVGNVESKELLIDPNQYGAGGVPKVLADYTNLPSHPSDGSIDDRGTVPLPEGKFIITKAMANKYKIAEQSNDGLLSSAVTNKVAFDKNKKEQQEMQKASNAYGRFMAKYGGAIQKMYACGGKTYGCGGMVKKYDGGASIFGPTALNSYLATPTAPATPEGFMGIPYALDYNPYTAEGRYDMLDPNYAGNYSKIGKPLKRTDGYGTVTVAPMRTITQIPNPGVDNATVVANTPLIDNQRTQFNPGTQDDRNSRTNQVLGALQLAAPLYNLGRGMFGKKMNIPEDLGMVEANIKAPRMTDAQGRRAINEQLNLAKYNLSQMGGANLLPGLTSLGTAGMKTMADYTENMRNKQATLDYEALVRNKAIEQANAQQRLQNLMSQAQIDAAKDNLISTGVGQVGEAAGYLRRENTMKNVYKDLFANYNYINGNWVPRKPQ
jgi:hypothetical protein